MEVEAGGARERLGKMGAEEGAGWVLMMRAAAAGVDCVCMREAM